MAAGYQPEEVQNASRPMGDITGAAVSRPLTMTVPPTSIPTMFLLNPMLPPHIKRMPTQNAAPIPPARLNQ